MNVRAGSSDAATVSRVREAASRHNAEFIECSDGKAMENATRQAVTDGMDVVIAAGGDGTINTVASILAESRTALGILPAGTLNHFAKDLGIPLDVDDAMQLIDEGTIDAIDVGRVNDRWFVNNSGLGLYPYMVHHREAVQRRGWSKWFAALIASLRALSRYRLLRLHIRVNGEQLLRRTPAVFVGNNEYRLDIGVEPKRLTLRDGQLCLYIPHVQGRWELFLFSLRALFGSRHDDPSLDMFLTDRFTIDSRHRHLRVSIDGEALVMKTPLEYSIAPRALRVLVPAGSR